MKSKRPAFLTVFRTKNKKARIINYVLLAILGIYAGIIVFPGFLFGHSVKYKNFNIQSTQPVDDSILRLLDETETKLSMSEIFDSTLTHDIYFCNSFKLYTLLAPLSRRAFACNYPLFNNIFIAQTDLKENKAYKNNPDDNYTREISALLAHEITHTFIENRIGFWKFRTLSPWKNEGYSEYVGLGKRNFSEEDQEFLMDQEDRQKPGDYYKKYYMAVNHLMRFEQMNFEGLMATERSLDEVLNTITNKPE